MPVQDLIAGLTGDIPGAVREVASGLQYRDFITVGVLLKQLAGTDPQTGKTTRLHLKDNWIYIQEKDVKVGRLQLFGNWSPYMVKDPSNTWIGMEYFCNQTDAFWKLQDEAIRELAIGELITIGLARKKMYWIPLCCAWKKPILPISAPTIASTWYGSSRILSPIFSSLAATASHKYNNSDHSMLTAMVAVDNICNGITDKSNLWQINTEQEYHEEKSE